MACQQHVAEFLRACGWEPRVYGLDEVVGLEATSSLLERARLHQPAERRRTPEGHGRRTLAAALGPHRYRSTRDTTMDARRFRRSDRGQSSLRPRLERYEGRRGHQPVRCRSGRAVGNPAARRSGFRDRRGRGVRRRQWHARRPVCRGSTPMPPSSPSRRFCASAPRSAAAARRTLHCAHRRRRAHGWEISRRRSRTS